MAGMAADAGGHGSTAAGSGLEVRPRARLRFVALLCSLLAGVTLAALPGVAGAQSRELEPPSDFSGVMVLTALAVLALFLVASIGYLYRRERGLRWDFQKPDAEEHHD